MRERGIDQAVSLFYDPEKGTTEIVLSDKKGLVGQLILVDQSRALMLTDGRHGRPKKPHLIRLPERLADSR